MHDWQLTFDEWYEIPRADRVMMAAQRQAQKLLDAMLQYDYREDAKQEADRNRNKGKR